MTYKPTAERLDIIMPLARQLGITPQKVIDMLILEAIAQRANQTHNQKDKS